MKGTDREIPLSEEALPENALYRGENFPINSRKK
jgi:hypothetical protein